MPPARFSPYDDLPERPPEHVRADQSRFFLQRVLPPEWVQRTEYTDYGVDVRVEIVVDHRVTGREFLVQLKASARPDWNTTRSFISYPCTTRSLKYYLARPEPVLLVVYDVRLDRGYWVWVQDYVRERAQRGWELKHKLVVRIPSANELTPDSVDSLARRTAEYHDRAIMLQAIASAPQNPYWEPVVTFRDSCTTFGLTPRYVGAENDCPLTIEGTFIFENTPEGREAYRALKHHFATGAPVQLDSRFLGQFRLPEIIERLLPMLDWQPTSLTIASAPSPSVIPLALRVLDTQHRLIGDLPYVPVSEVQRGADEVTLESTPPSLESPQRFLSFKISRSGTLLKARQQTVNQPIRHLRDFFRFQSAMHTGAFVQLVNLETGATLQSPFSGLNPPPNEDFVSFLEAVVFIEETTGHMLRWPGECSKETALAVERTVDILRTGRLHQNADTVSFAFPIESIERLLEQLPDNEWTSLILDSNDARITLFGETILLGPARTTLPEVRLTQEEHERLAHATSESTKGFVRITLEVGQSGAETVYSRWLRTEQL